MAPIASLNRCTELRSYVRGAHMSTKKEQRTDDELVEVGAGELTDEAEDRERNSAEEAEVTEDEEEEDAAKV